MINYEFKDRAQGIRVLALYRIMRSRQRPIRPIANIPVRIKSVRKTVLASLMRNPRPEFAPTSSAATKAIQPTPRPIRIPVVICGRAALRMTRVMTLQSPAPKPRAARIKLGSTFFTASIVFKRIGKNIPKKIIN